MANKQHIYKGAGAPRDVFPDLDEVEGHHYLDTETGDVYIGGIDGSWVKVNDRSAIGIFSRLEVKSAPVGPTGPIPEPSGPMLWIDESNGDAYLATATGGPASTTWAWRKISFI